MARSQKQIDRENAEAAKASASNKGGRSQKQIDRENAQKISVKYTDGPLEQGKTGNEKLCSSLTVQNNGAITSLKTCASGGLISVSDIAGAINKKINSYTSFKPNKIEVKNICSKDQKVLCESINKLISDEYKTVIFDKGVKACLSAHISAKLDHIYSVEGIKICITDVSEIKELDYLLDQYSDLKLTCINDPFGKSICNELTGKNANLNANFVDDFSY